MKQHLHRMAGLCLAVTLLLTAAGRGRQGGPGGPPPPCVPPRGGRRSAGRSGEHHPLSRGGDNCSG